MTRKAKIGTAKATPEVPASDTATTPEGRLASGLILRELSRAGVPVAQSGDALKAQVARALKELRQTDAGAALAKKIQAGMSAAGPLLRECQLASGDNRHMAITAARSFLAWAAQHDVSDDAALSRLMSAARWSSTEAMLRERLLAGSLSGSALEAHVRLADRASTSARYELTAALDLEAKSKASKPKSLWPWQSAPVARVAPRALPEAEEVDPDEPNDPGSTSTDDEPDAGEDEHDDQGEDEARPNSSLVEDPPADTRPTGPGWGGLPRLPTRVEPPADAVPHVVGMSLSPRTTAIPVATSDQWGRPIVVRGGPSQAARDEMREKHRMQWDDASQRWTKEGRTP